MSEITKHLKQNLQKDNREINKDLLPSLNLIAFRFHAQDKQALKMLQKVKNLSFLKIFLPYFTCSTAVDVVSSIKSSFCECSECCLGFVQLFRVNKMATDK